MMNKVEMEHRIEELEKENERLMDIIRVFIKVIFEE